MRDFAREEQTFTVPYAAYFTGISVRHVKAAVAKLQRNEIVEIIEPAQRGRLGGPAVYGYIAIDRTPVPRPQHYEHIPADLAPARGQSLAFTGQTKGPSGKPGENRVMLKRGHRVRKKKSTGHK